MYLNQKVSLCTLSRNLQTPVVTTNYINKRLARIFLSCVKRFKGVMRLPKKTRTSLLAYFCLRQKRKYLKSFWDEIKGIIRHFKWLSFEQTKPTFLEGESPALEKTNQILCILYKVMYLTVILGCKLCHLQVQLSESPSIHQFSDCSPWSSPKSSARRLLPLI